MIDFLFKYANFPRPNWEEMSERWVEKQGPTKMQKDFKSGLAYAMMKKIAMREEEEKMKNLTESVRFSEQTPAPERIMEVMTDESCAVPGFLPPESDRTVVPEPRRALYESMEPRAMLRCGP